MKTDDFLTDLEAQLRTARPRRDPRPLLALGAALLVAALVLAFAAGGGERDAVPTAAPRLVMIQNATGSPAAGRQAADTLERAGYRVMLSRAPKAEESAVLSASAAEQDRIADLLDLRDTDGWTPYAPLEDATRVTTVVLGRVEPAVRVALTNTGGDARIASRVRRSLPRSALVLVIPGGRPLEHTFVAPVNAGTRAQASAVADALGVPLRSSVSGAALTTDDSVSVVVAAGRELSRPRS